MYSRSKSDEFKNLCWSSERLQEALNGNPNLIKEQDEDGMTLLHHAAQVGYVMGSSNASEILKVLFNAPGIDFTIKDQEGNTPVHVAALCCADRVTCQYVFPTIVKEAVKHNFDFSTLGQQGQSVLHMASRTSYTDPRGLFGRINNIKNVLDNAPNSGLDTLSSSGSTALFYAVNHCHFDEAKALLDAGANPMIFGSRDRDPFAMIEEHLKTFTEALANDEYADRKKNIQGMIDKLTELKSKMLSNAQAKSHAEIRKAARILAQGQRSTGTLFTNLSDEILIKIAGHANESGINTEKEAEKIAHDNLGRPQ